MSALEKRISNSHGFVQQRAKTFFGGTLGETFEAFAIESDLCLSRRKERLLKLEDQQQSSQFVCGARCTTVNGTEFEFHAIPRKLRDHATLKIDSGEKSFPLEVANQVAHGHLMRQSKAANTRAHAARRDGPRATAPDAACRSIDVRPVDVLSRLLALAVTCWLERKRTADPRRCSFFSLCEKPPTSMTDECAPPQVLYLP